MYVTRPSSFSPRSLLADQPELRLGIHQVYKGLTPDESATSPPVLPNQPIGPRKSLARRTQGTARIGEALQPRAQSYSSRRMFERSEQTAVCGESLKSSSSRNTLWTDFICCSPHSCNGALSRLSISFHHTHIFIFLFYYSLYYNTRRSCGAHQNLASHRDSYLPII
jgi:hypothetical protein